MSPLVRSLLALAVLLAAVDAQYRCITKIIGRTSDDDQDLTPVDIPYKQSYLEVKDFCEPPKYLVGEKITVCTNTPGTWEKARIIPPPCPEVSPARINCHDPSGCRAFTTEFCDY